MVYTTTFRGYGLESQSDDTSAFRSGTAARRQFLEASKAKGTKGKSHVSISLTLGGTEIFRAHGMGVRSAFLSFRDHLGRMSAR